MSTLNLGILAHVDAGKTSLTERLLYDAGVIDEIGSVDAGSTQTDSLALERQRGITIKSAVVSFVVDDVTVNLIDTPGHPDFIAEVERVLTVLDGAVLVISAVEGVQAQTRVLMRTLRRLRIPTLIFVNKIDRAGAQDERMCHGIAEKLGCVVVPMGSVVAAGTREAAFRPATEATPPVLELLAEHDDTLLAAYVEDDTDIGVSQVRTALAAQTGQSLVHPVFFGSAVTGAGVQALTAAVTEFLPTLEGDVDAPVSGDVFKIERGGAGERIAYANLVSGTVRIRDRLPSARGGHQTVTAISVFEHGSVVRRTSLSAGQIGKLWGLADIRIGDAIGVARPGSGRAFAPPTLETVVVPTRRADRGTMYAALAQLAEQDPLINVRRDPDGLEVWVSLYGEVQKQVIRATLADDYGVDVSFRETTTICVERLVGVGRAVEIIDQDVSPFLAGIGLRVEPGPTDSGIEFRLEVELGSMPLAFFTAVEETVKEALQQGLYGWQVIDCAVIMTYSDYWARQSHSHAVFDKSMSSTAGDFRNLTPLVVMDALIQAGTLVHEPMHQFQLEFPAESLGPILSALARLRGVPGTPTMRGSTCLLDGDLPAAQVHELTRQLPGLTHGDGVLESSFAHYRPVRGPIPSRPHSNPNPLNRKEYLLQVVQRVTGRPVDP